MPLRRRSTSRLQRAVETLRPQARREPGRAVLAAGALVSAVAAFMTVRWLRRGETGTVYHVRAGDEAGWVLTEGRSSVPLDRFDQKRQAIEAGRELARRQGPSTLLIHRSNGDVARRHIYAGD